MGKISMAEISGFPADKDANLSELPYGRNSTGILPSHVLRRLIAAQREVLASEEITDVQIQPASIDLRLGPVAYRVRASFLPGEAPRGGQAFQHGHP